MIIHCRRLHLLRVVCSKLGWKRYERRYTNRNLMKLHERGLLQDFFPDSINELQTLLSKQQCVYAGFDPTSDSLHVGNLLVLMTLLHGQRGGHQIIAVVGGATALVGDPSGHSSERQVMKLETVEQNASQIRSSLLRIFHNHEKHFWKDSIGDSPLLPIKVLNNMEWYSKRSIIDFTSLVGRCFRLGDMLSKLSVKSRLESSEGMNFAEFSYQVFQAYDWLHLYDKYQCNIQIGGSDQMGNIHAGHELINKTRNKRVYGLLGPLIMSESGFKIGKSGGNAVWLNADKTTPFEFYQYFVRLPDSEVKTYLKLFTFLSLTEIEQLEEKHSESPDAKRAQKKIAESVTLLVHGEDGLKSALRTTDVLYNANPETLALLSEEELVQIFNQANSVSLLLHPGTTILQMVMRANCFSREVDALRIIEAGGLHVNYRKTTNPNYVLIPGEHILPNNFSVIRIGKKSYHLVKWLK